MSASTAPRCRALHSTNKQRNASAKKNRTAGSPDGPAQQLQAAGFLQQERVTRGHIPSQPFPSSERFQPERHWSRMHLPPAYSL
jgi:hypothetical protein